MRQRTDEPIDRSPGLIEERKDEKIQWILLYLSFQYYHTTMTAKIEREKKKEGDGG